MDTYFSNEGVTFIPKLFLEGYVKSDYNKGKTWKIRE